MSLEIQIHQKDKLGIILLQGEDALFIPERLIPDVAHTMTLACDGIPFTADVDYIQILYNEDGLTLFDGHEAVFCEGEKILKLRQAVIA